MSKPWFLSVAEDPALVDLKGAIKGVIGRELNDPGKVVQQAEVHGVKLDEGEGLGRRESKESDATLVDAGAERVRDKLQAMGLDEEPSGRTGIE